MSYDIALVDPVTNETLMLDVPHHMRGGTYQIGGSMHASLNVTYNYAPILYRVLDGGIRSIYGMTGLESIEKIDQAINQLSDVIDEDYWKSTEGNVKRALIQLKTLAQMRPDGVWDGD